VGGAPLAASAPVLLGIRTRSAVSSIAATTVALTLIALGTGRAVGVPGLPSGSAVSAVASVAVLRHTVGRVTALAAIAPRAAGGSATAWAALAARSTLSALHVPVGALAALPAGAAVTPYPPRPGMIVGSCACAALGAIPTRLAEAAGPAGGAGVVRGITTRAAESPVVHAVGVATAATVPPSSTARSAAAAGSPVVPGGPSARSVRTIASSAALASTMLAAARPARSSGSTMRTRS
jgi:hypothetical protein